MKRVLSIGFTIATSFILLTACGAANHQTDRANPGIAASAPTHEDQLSFEQSIRDFASALAKKDFKTAAQYCTPDFAGYLETLVDGTGVTSDGFSAAVINGYPLTLKEVKGFYETDSAQPDFNISEDRPTVNFFVTLEYVDSAGNTGTAGGYVKGIKGKDGTYLIGGFASGL